MRFSEQCQQYMMKHDRNKWRRLKRKKFNDLMTEANLDYLYDRKMHPRKYVPGSEFEPMTTPNRNPEQVPDGTWRRLLHKHLNNHFYN